MTVSSVTHSKSRQWKVLTVNKEYEVSNDGAVRRIDSMRVLSPKPRINGYISVLLQFSCGRKKRRFYVHRLVAQEFCGGIEEGMHVNHLNFCRHDNRAENLEVVTCRQNAEHSRLAGRYAGNKYNAPRGNLSCRSKLTFDQVVEMRMLSTAGVINADLSRLFGVTKTQVSNILKRKSWSGEQKPMQLAATA